MTHSWSHRQHKCSAKSDAAKALLPVLTSLSPHDSLIAVAASRGKKSLLLGKQCTGEPRHMASHQGCSSYSDLNTSLHILSVAKGMAFVFLMGLYPSRPGTYKPGGKQLWGYRS